MDIFWTCVIGLVIGAVAKLLIPGRQPGGLLGTIAAGIAGAWIARWAADNFGLYVPLPGQFAGFASSVAGAIGVLLVWTVISGMRS